MILLSFFNQQRLAALFPLLAAFGRHVLRFMKSEQCAEQFAPVPVIQAGQVEQQALQDQAMITGLAFGILTLARMGLWQRLFGHR